MRSAGTGQLGSAEHAHGQAWSGLSSALSEGRWGRGSWRSRACCHGPCALPDNLVLTHDGTGNKKCLRITEYYEGCAISEQLLRISNGKITGKSKGNLYIASAELALG